MNRENDEAAGNATPFVLLPVLRNQRDVYSGVKPYRESQMCDVALGAGR